MSINLELIVLPDLEYIEGLKISLPLRVHVHKRIERFIYQQKIQKESVPIAYLENKALNSKQNLIISRRNYLVPANSPLQIEKRKAPTKINGLAYTSQFKEIAATNKVFTNKNGRRLPLFFRHQLPPDTVQAEVKQIRNGNRRLVDEGMIVDLNDRSVYTNQRNEYDEKTGSYSIFFVHSVNKAGVATVEMLNPVPVANKAGWEDIDLTTGALTTDYPLYSVDSSSSGYTYYFNQGGTWYIRPTARSLIQAQAPMGRTPRDPWFIRFTNGDVTALVNGAVRRYYLPEFDRQSFIPSKPTIFSPYNTMIQVNKRVLSATRDTLRIDPASGLHLELFIYDADEVLIKVLTTDASKEGLRYSNTDVFYETDKIASWDNRGGFVSLGINILTSWIIKASYYYDADDYEYVGVDLNPIINKDAQEYMYVFYCLPDVHEDDDAIHYLKVNRDGIIVDLTQGPGGVAYPNLQLRELDGSYNPNTVVGMKYVSMLDSATFMNLYGAGGDNDYGYMLLAEVSPADFSIVEDQLDIDVRRAGDAIKPDHYQQVFTANGRILQSKYGYGEMGQEVPENAVIIIDVPLSLQAKYGGVLEPENIETALRQHMPAAGYAVINWVYPQSELSGYSIVSQTVDLSFTWEGPGLTYRLWRKETESQAFELIYEITNPPKGTLTFQDTNVESGKVYIYAMSIVENDIEYPYGNNLKLEVL